MDEMIKQRLVGAVVLALLAAILLPWLFGDPRDPRDSIQASFAGSPVPQPTPEPRPEPTLEPARQSAAAPTIAPRRPARTPAPTARPAPVEASTPPPATAQAADSAHWVLQLVSYRQRKQADAFLERLRKDGHAAYYESVTIQGRTYYRVRLKLTDTRAGALLLKKKLEKTYRLQAQLLASR